jgi:hypothetical protein
MDWKGLLLGLFTSLVFIGAGVYLFYLIFTGGSHEDPNAVLIFAFIAFGLICLGGFIGYYSITYKPDYF